MLTEKQSIAIVRAFNNCINNQDIEGLSDLMAENHTFIERDGQSHAPKQHMVEGWKEFFKMFPRYKNSFTKIGTSDELVCVLGYAYWSEKETYDPVIWTARIENNLISEWRIYEDSAQNRMKFNLL
ncbi:MAG: nuclear transport factor 2 family protein [Bacteroidota bacterium]|nr:nuclear transport factor 2 family protein [Bacteroidota bacterium]